MNSEVTFFAKTNFRGQEVPFGIKTDDRRRHMYVIGKTGMGKTNLIENMAIQDIQNGKGVAVVDPHGEFAEKMVKAIPPERINDVIYFNPADLDFPIAFNVMERVDHKYHHLVSSGLVGVFKKIWAESWGPRLEYILRNAILALLEYPGSTLLGINRILVDKSYRQRVVNKITDPVVKSFWVDEFPAWDNRILQEVVSPIQNKVGQFLQSSLMRNIVGQTRSAFDIREVMDNKKIFIMNLSKGRIGEDSGALLGAMMITKIQLAAMSRVDDPEEQREDFYLYVDEFQNFATEAFVTILSEARKYRLNLILAHQYITQLGEEVRDAIFGNMGTLVTFRIGATDAEYFEKEFFPIFTANDLVNLAKYNVYLKLMIDGIAGDAFSAAALPPADLGDTQQNVDKVIRISRERYASTKKEVEEKIMRWSGMLLPDRMVATAQTRQPITSPRGELKRSVRNVSPSVSPPALRNQKPAVAEKEKPEQELFHSICATCGIEITVPFKPDSNRPTFCKECLKDYQRAVAKSRLRGHRTVQNISSPRKKEVVMEPKLIVRGEKPFTFAQIQRIAPKKFSTHRNKLAVDLGEVRKLIQGNLNKKNHVGKNSHGE